MKVHVGVGREALACRVATTWTATANVGGSPNGSVYGNPGPPNLTRTDIVGTVNVVGVRSHQPVIGLSTFQMVAKGEVTTYPPSGLICGAYCVIICGMFFKIMGIVCDACDEETSCEGRQATMAQVTSQARREGWAISSAGHFCPQHRRRG